MRAPTLEFKKKRDQVLVCNLFCLPELFLNPHLVSTAGLLIRGKE
jgi:hypothetical protein